MQNCIDLSTCVYIDFAKFCNVAYRKAIKRDDPIIVIAHDKVEMIPFSIVASGVFR